MYALFASVNILMSGSGKDSIPVIIEKAAINTEHEVTITLFSNAIVIASLKRLSCWGEDVGIIVSFWLVSSVFVRNLLSA
jgi:hypothetical protein